MTMLPVPISYDFSVNPLVNTDEIDFTDAPVATKTATFASSQFNNVAILDTVEIDGSTNADHLVVNGGAVNASLWQFANWNSADTITLNGGVTADTITGSLQNDTIVGGGGLDNLNGGGGNDTFGYMPGDIVAGEVVDGAGGQIRSILRGREATTLAADHFQCFWPDRVQCRGHIRYGVCWSDQPVRNYHLSTAPCVPGDHHQRGGY